MVKSLNTFSFRQTGGILLYLFAIVTLGSFNVGPLSLRVYSTVIMLLYLCVNIRRFNSLNVIPISNTYIKLYILFLFIFFICLCITGDLVRIGFFRRLLAYDLVCIVTFFAIYIMINSRPQLRQVVVFLLLICMIDAIVTILQVRGNDLGWVIGRFIAPFENAKELAERNTEMLGVSIAPGIFGNIVANAFKLTSFAPLALAFLNKKEKPLLSIVFNVVALVAIFLTQQRAAFYLFLFTWLVYLSIRVIRKPILLLFLIFAVALISIKVEGFFSEFDFGRLISVHDDARSNLAQYALVFIPDHFLFGGISEFMSITGYSTHNLIFDSFIFAGVGGFIILMTFDIKICLICTRYIQFFVKGKCSQMTFALAMAMLSSTLYGFTHNTSVLTGDVVVFILLALLLKSIQLDKIH